jgi:hypothetical protein
MMGFAGNLKRHAPMTEKTCFVIGPIGPEISDIRRHADWLLEGIISPVVTNLGFRAVRADKISIPGMIDSQVINLVIDADLVVVDLSFWNANAFYELALRHMAEKPVIHMIDRSNQEIPFDVKPYRTILFGWTSYKELEQSKDDLEAQMREIVDESHTVDNPVIRARGQIKLRQTASPREQEMLSMIEDLRSQISQMQKAVEHNYALEETRRDLNLELEKRRAEMQAERAELHRKIGTIEGGFRAASGPTGSATPQLDAFRGISEPPYPPPDVNKGK